jgi:signal transduction histidine kinase
LEEILSNTDLLKNEDVQVYLNCLKTGIDRITGIVSGLNQFSRDNLAMDEDCYLHSIIDNCLNVLSGQIKNRIEIEKCYFDSPFIIKGNVGKMHQVFLNLLTNSIQAIKDVGKITIKTTQTANNQKLIEIIDTGTGIDESIIDRITEPFFTTKEPGKGTGLGLTITYNIIKEHEGTLYFDSLLNKGTNARIVFR